MKRRGFTIVELIIVITIMGILMVLGVVNMRSAQANARDVERKADIESIAFNLENYYTSGTNDSTACPTNFIPVQGNPTYGTSDFCVMKYEAKAINGVATSVADGAPWVDISQVNAITAATAACSGCHITTEAEWITIAQNTLNVANNWNNGSGAHAVGTGYIYSGHNDNSPTASLAASTDDTDGYYGTGNSGNSNQKRTLTLSNGEVIWDFAGNVWEYTSNTIAGGSLPGISGEAGYAYKEWNNGSLSLRGFSSIYAPSYGTPAAAGWTTSHGIGNMYSYYSDATTRVIRNGGDFGSGTAAGIFATRLNYSTTTTSIYQGFRASVAGGTANIVYGTYPSTLLTSNGASYIDQLLRDIDTKSITAPGITDPTLTFITATNAVQTTAGISPQPTINQYVYQPLKSDGTLCTAKSQECRKFNLYYRLETDNTVYMVTSRNQ